MTTYKEVEIVVPVEEEQTKLVNQVVIETYKKMRKVPVITQELIPDPPCHWHEMEHRHGVEAGKLHKHNM